MNKILIVAIIAIVIIAFGAYLYFSVDDIGQITSELDQLAKESPEGGIGSCDYNNRDIHAALCVLSGKALPWRQTADYIDSLNMKLCSIDGLNFAEVGNTFKNSWESNGYTLISERNDYRPSYSTYTGAWYKLLNGRAVIAGSGSGITSYYGHDTMFITTSGPVTTYYSFVTFVNSV